MADLQPVLPPPTILSGHGALIGWLVAIALLVVIVKPWGASDSGTTIAASSATPTPRPSPTPTPAPPPQSGYSDREYDPSIFGEVEPPAVWGLWPTGFLTTFGFVSQIPDDLSASASPSASDIGPGPTADRGPTWPATFDIPTGGHLLLVGVDLPRGFQVESVTLSRREADGSPMNVPLERFASPWPSHFAVVGLPLRAGDRHLEIWPPGRYRLELTFGPGSIRRSMDIEIAEPPRTP